MTTSDKLLSLDNIRRQFRQDCIVSYKNFVFEASPLSIMSASGMPTDKDGFPVPFGSDDCYQLAQMLKEAYEKARKTYFERMGGLGLDKLTEVKTSEDEETE